MHRLTITVTLALLALMIAPAALAQETSTEPPDGVTDERFSTAETRELSRQINEAEARYAANEDRIEQLEDAFEFGDERDRLMSENAEMDDSNPELREDLVSARVEAIRSSAAPPADQVAALERVEAYAEDELDYRATVESGVSEALASAEEEQRSAGASDGSADSGESGSSGDDGGSGGSAEGPDGGSDTGVLATLNSALIAVVSFVFGLFFLWGLTLAAMFALAWRREGGAGPAWASTMRPGRIALAFLIAFILTLLGGIGFIFNIAFFAVIALAVAFFVIRSREGSSGAALERMRSWLPGQGRGPGGATGGPGEYDEDRRGRNVAGAKGEAQVNEVLAGLVRAGLYGYVFANLKEPSVGNIDHVLVGKGGTWVVETKANQGEIVLDENGTVTANGKPFARDPFDQALGQLDAISDRIGDIDGDILVCVPAATDIQYPAEETGRADRLVSLLGMEATVASVGGEKPNSEVDRIAEQIMGHYGTAPIASPTGPTPTPGPTGGPAPATSGPSPDGDGRPALERYCRNITAEAREGHVEEAIGRADELEAVVEILTRRKVNNAVLTGDAGVGKTALVEELARKLAAGRVPPALQGMEVLELSTTALQAGATLVGMFDERLQSVIDEIKAEPDRYILFVDEMHSLMSAGTHSQSSSGASDILKPALARGELRMVGATTSDEYREIEADPAMARRFERVHIRPLTVAETTEVLRRMSPKQERHYSLRVEEEALAAAARMADRYITDQQLPAKAVNVLETACSRVALRDGDAVTADDVAAVISRQSGVPVGSMSGDDRQQMAALEDSLRERVVGQDEAVAAIADAVRRKRAGFGDRKPASFGFFGPTGTGKTELAKALAEVLFGDEDAMTRLDMSEYQNEGDTWRLLGAASGYQGAEQGGQLTEPIRRRPYSVVLFDEIEKAHPQILDPLLQVMDDGRLTDGKGRTVDFSNTVVIMTSNLASEVVIAAHEHGAEVSEEEMAEALVERGMRPEMVQRVGQICVFRPLEAGDVLSVARKMVEQTATSVRQDHGVEVYITDEALSYLADRGYDPANGMRPLRRVVEREVEQRLSDLVIQGKVQSGDAIELATKDDGALGVRWRRRAGQGHNHT